MQIPQDTHSCSPCGSDVVDVTCSLSFIADVQLSDQCAVFLLLMGCFHFALDASANSRHSCA